MDVKLQNGSEVRHICMKADPTCNGGMTGYVLAQTGASVESWVTWAVDGDGFTYAGHYFATRGAAWADYLERIAGLGVR